MPGKGKLLGAVMKDARTRSGLTAEALAEKIGSSVRYVYSLESGSSTPSFELLSRIVQELSIEPARIFYQGLNNTDTEYKILVSRLSRCSSETIKMIDGILDTILEHSQEEKTDNKP